jgi:hypothetical protein
MNEAVSLNFDRRPSALPYMVRGMIPVTRRRELAPRISAQWHQHRADPGDLADFNRITGLEPCDATLPLLYPHTFGFRLAMAVLTHPRFPVPIWGVLQTRNHLVQHRPIAVDQPLDFETTVMHGRVMPKGAEFDLRTTSPGTTTAFICGTGTRADSVSTFALFAGDERPSVVGRLEVDLRMNT